MGTLRMLEMLSRSESLQRSDHLCLFKSLPPRKAEMLAATTDSTLLIQIAALRKNVLLIDVMSM